MMPGDAYKIRTALYHVTDGYDKNAPDAQTQHIHGEANAEISLNRRRC